MMMKMLQLVVLIALFAIGHAEMASQPITVNAVVAAAPAAPLSTTATPSTPNNELSEWEEYKAHFKKVYGTVEDRFRHNVYFANKEKKAKYDELQRLGLPASKLELNVYADFTCDELKVPEEFQTEWDNYKITYGKSYDEYEDRFRKTVYFIVKDIITAHNKLFERGLVPNQLQLNWAGDRFFDELPALYALPSVSSANPWRDEPLPWTPPPQPIPQPPPSNQLRFMAIDDSPLPSNDLQAYSPLPSSPPSPPPLPVPYSLPNPYRSPRVYTFVQDRSGYTYQQYPNPIPNPNSNIVYRNIYQYPQYPNQYPQYPNQYPQYPSPNPQFPNQFPNPQYPNGYPNSYPNSYPNAIVYPNSQQYPPYKVFR